jgi:hypothetical protein
MYPEAAVNLLYNGRNAITNDLRMLVRSERYFVKTLGLHFFKTYSEKSEEQANFSLKQ